MPRTLHTSPPWIISDNLRCIITEKKAPIAETFEQSTHPASGDSLREQRANAKLIAASPEMIEALILGDSLGNDGPLLLRTAADLVKGFAPNLHRELLRKADAEEAAITSAI